MGVPRATLPAREENELYYSDLVGLAVVNRQGARLGVVSKVQDFGAHPVLCVADEVTARERMIPFVAVYVDGVDVAAGGSTSTGSPIIEARNRGAYRCRRCSRRWSRRPQDSA